MPTSRTIGEIIQLYFAFNAPDTADGLAGSTFRTYRHSASCHLLGKPGVHRGKPRKPAAYALVFVARPAADFNKPDAPRYLREAMKIAGVGASARAHAWRVLSAVLSWAAASQLVPEITTNGCLLARENVGRRKSTRGSNGRSGARRSGQEILSWALSPVAVELIRAEMLNGCSHEPGSLLSGRDATIMSLQFGLALRPQEIYALRWSALVGDRARPGDVLESNKISAKAKTEAASCRSARVPQTLRQDLDEWRTLLVSHGFPVRNVDFVVPGNLAGIGHGVLEAETGAQHFSSNQAKKWGPRYLTTAITSGAHKDPRFVALSAATPYSLRRGGISARLRCEDAQSVASQCGTSLEMLSQHYSYEIDEFAHTRPTSVDEQWQRARSEVAESTCC